MTEIHCPSCGSSKVEQIGANQYRCPYCGNTFTTKQSDSPQTSQQPVFNRIQNLSPDVDDNPGCLMNGVCFLIPLIGIIMYFVKKDTQPNCAKSYLTWAIVSIGIGVFFNIVAAIAS